MYITISPRHWVLLAAVHTGLSTHPGKCFVSLLKAVLLFYLVEAQWNGTHPFRASSFVRVSRPSLHSLLTRTSSEWACWLSLDSVKACFSSTATAFFAFEAAFARSVTRWVCPMISWATDCLQIDDSVVSILSSPHAYKRSKSCREPDKHKGFSTSLNSKLYGRDGYIEVCQTEPNGISGL